jgi:hypothetical protein
MSTARINSISLAHPRPERFGSRWERLLAVASICLPIPLLAATGLSIPLPGSVERVGAALVAWVDQAAELSPLPETGAIVLADETDTAPEARDEVVLAARATAAQTAATHETAAGGDSRPKGGGGKDGSDDSESGGSGGGGSGGSSPPTGGGGGSGGSNQPGLVEGTVGEVTKTTEPVLDLVDDTLGGVGETVDGLLPTDDLLGGGGLLGGGLLGSGK